MRRRMADTSNVDAIARKFRWADSDTFAKSFFGDPLFGSVEEARRAWQAPGVRRSVWARQHRMSIPDASRVFDALSRDGWQFLWSNWQLEGPFAVNKALQAVAADRETVDRFERRDPRGARSIRDYLEQWREDLATLETIARDLGAFQGDSWMRPAPTHLMSTALRYGAGDGVHDDDAA